jgi:hypothetical protein
MGLPVCGGRCYIYDMKKTIYLAGICWLMGGPVVVAQPAAAAHRLDAGLATFFAGQWTGKGAFANGRAIAADLSFVLSLDSCWLQYEHRDQAPNTYKAMSMWGVDKTTGEFVAYCFDNFQGHRLFSGNGAGGGWQGGKLVLTHEASAPQVGKYFERFVYERISEAQFKMTYEVSRDSTAWQMGDWLVFTRAEIGRAPKAEGR